MYNKQTSMLGGPYDTTEFVEKVSRTCQNKNSRHYTPMVEWFICNLIHFRIMYMMFTYIKEPGAKND